MRSRAARIGLVLVIVGCGLAVLVVRPPESARERDVGIAVNDITDFSARPETRWIHFGAGFDDRTALLEGWSFDEYDRDADLSFVWADAREASVRFTVIQPEDKQVLLKARPFPGDATETVDVLVNGQPVARLRLNDWYSEYRFRVRKRVLVEGENRLSFVHSNLHEKPTVGGWPQDRSFAAAYSFVLIGPDCLRLRPFGDPESPGVAPSVPSASAPVRVVGPAEVRFRPRNAEAATLHLALHLERKSPGPANAILQVGDGAEWTTVAAERLARWFGRGGKRRIDVDLSRWRGRNVAVRLLVTPDSCTSVTTHVTVDRLWFS